MAQLAAIAMGRNDNPQDMFDEVQDIVYLNDQAALPDPPTSIAEIRDIYEMKLPPEDLTVIAPAKSKDQREPLANHVPVIVPGATASDLDTVAPIVYTAMTIDVLEEAVMDHYYFLNTSSPFEATLAVVAPRNY